MKKKHYIFVNTWTVDASIDKIEYAVLDAQNWTNWWPGLEAVKIIEYTPKHVGKKAEFIWRTSGYRLSTIITITGHSLGRIIKFSSEGDLAGFGTWEFASENDASKLVVTWDVYTQKTWMNLFGPMLRPVFVFNHNRLMNRGENGLKDYLSKK